MSIRTIAYYLPQFYPYKENNEWWGEGFTEWTNVGKAKPLFKDHYQPRVPKDLGYYDLRLPESRAAQAAMAKQYGIEGFCYWHYWFGNGKRVLERVFDEVLSSGNPDFPFCLGWANETWSGIWHGLDKKILVEQSYPGVDDYEKHFYKVLPAFLDKRYIRVNNKPLFLVYQPLKLPDNNFLLTWKRLAAENGLEGIYFVGHTNYIEDKKKILDLGFDSININRLSEVARKGRSIFSKALNKTIFRSSAKVNVYNYKEAIEYFSGEEDRQTDCHPCIIPNWDHAPRSNGKRLILHNSSPELFRKHVKQVFQSVKDKPEDSRIVFLKSWNEWGEGNYMEPDLKYGRGYLEVFKEELDLVVSNKTI